MRNAANLILLCWAFVSLSAAEPIVLQLVDTEEPYQAYIHEAWLERLAATGYTAGPIIVPPGFPPIPSRDNAGRYDVLQFNAVLESKINPTRAIVTLLGDPDIITDLGDSYRFQWTKPRLVTSTGKESTIEAVIKKTQDDVTWTAAPFPVPIATPAQIPKRL